MHDLLNELRNLRQEIQVIPSDRRAGAASATAANRYQYLEETAFIYSNLLKKADKLLFEIFPTLDQIDYLRNEASQIVEKAHQEATARKAKAALEAEAASTVLRRKEEALADKSQQLDALKLSYNAENVSLKEERNRAFEISKKSEIDYREKCNLFEQEYNARRSQVEKLLESGIAELKKLEKSVEAENTRKLQEAEDRLQGRYETLFNNLKSAVAAGFDSREQEITAREEQVSSREAAFAGRKNRLEEDHNKRLAELSEKHSRQRTALGEEMTKLAADYQGRADAVDAERKRLRKAAADLEIQYSHKFTELQAQEGRLKRGH